MRRRQQSVLGVLVVSSLLLAGGCEETIDASSKEAFDKSTQTIANGLDEAKKQQFTDALAALMMSKVLFASDGPMAAADKGGGTTAAEFEGAMLAKVKATFHGKTADEVIAEGEKAKAESKAEMQKLIQGK